MYRENFEIQKNNEDILKEEMKSVISQRDKKAIEYIKSLFPKINKKVLIAIDKNYTSTKILIRDSYITESSWKYLCSEYSDTLSFERLRVPSILNWFYSYAEIKIKNT